MHPNPRRVLPVLALVILALLAYWYWNARSAQAALNTLTGSGSIEITQVQIGPELGGKLTEVRVSEGDTTTARLCRSNQRLGRHRGIPTMDVAGELTGTRCSSASVPLL